MQETKPYTMRLLEELSRQFKTYGNIINFVDHPLTCIHRRQDNGYIITVFTSRLQEKELLIIGANDKSVAIATPLVGTFELTHEEASAALDESVKNLITESVWYTENCIKNHIAAKESKQQTERQAKIQNIKNIMVNQQLGKEI